MEFYIYHKDKDQSIGKQLIKSFQSLKKKKTVIMMCVADVCTKNGQLAA